jgi:hypothetical protein
VGKECRWRETFALIRLHFLAEGQTEEGFVNNILAPALGLCNVFADAHRITTGRRHGRIFRGGFTNYEQLARDLTLWMKQDQKDDSWFTTTIDFYGLPANFPSYEAAHQAASSLDQVVHLETALSEHIITRLDDLPVSQRFIPYIQLHEFEALLFADTARFVDAFPNEGRAIAQLTKARAQFSTPEDIDNHPLTAPSRRIINLLPDYEKTVAGLLIAQRIGLSTICRECPHFSNRYTRLTVLDD